MSLTEDAGILHTIFFHRFFPSLTPQTREVLDLTLPYVDDDELEIMIEQRATALESQLDAQRSSSSGNANATSNSGAPGGGRGQLVVQFFEKRRRKAWLSRGDEEVCWECWTIKVTVAEPRTESGAYNPEMRPLCSFVSSSIGMRRPPTPAILITTNPTPMPFYYSGCT